MDNALGTLQTFTPESGFKIPAFLEGIFKQIVPYTSLFIGKISLCVYLIKREDLFPCLFSHLISQSLGYCMPHCMHHLKL